MSAWNCTDQLKFLGKIAEVIIASDDLPTIGRLVVDLTVEFLEVETGILFWVDNADELVILGAHGLAREDLAWRGRVGQGLAGTLIADGVAVTCHDLSGDLRFCRLPEEPAATRVFAACPIMGKDRVLGLLTLNDSVGQRVFSPAELALLQAICAQTAMAMEKIMLAQAYRQKSVESEEANRRLIDQDIARTEFLTRVSHELRNPLNAIKGAIHLLQKSGQAPFEKRREFEDIVATETDRLLAMVNRQLDFLRIENESRLLRKTFFSLTALLQEVLHLSKGQREGSYRNLRIELNLEVEPGDIVGDKILVGQMITHLLDGLSAYVRQDPRVRISMRENADVNLLFQVSDRVPESLQQELLAVKNIYQADRPEETVKFYLAMKVAESHGWRLEVSNNDEGFRVGLRIPRAEHMRRQTALDLVMDRLLGFVAELLGVDTCSLMLSDELTGELTIRSARGLDEWIVQQTRLQPGDRIAGWVALEGQPLLIEDIETDPRFGRKNVVSQYRSKSLLSLPLFMEGQPIGVMNLNNKKSGGAFSQSDLALATTLCERLTCLIDRASRNQTPEGDLKELLSGLDKLLVAESRYAKKHRRYSELMVALMENLGVSQDEADISRYVSLVYDLGLMTIEDKLAGKGPLSAVESRAVRIHPEVTIGMLSALEFPDQALEAILYHHERFDGTGYPQGLKGNDIPLMARALAVVDAYCAMTEPRPHRGALSEDAALAELKKGKGSLFDPRVVKAFELSLAA
ncbi:MAG: GAF domain-containing protein [Desulfuromonadaceae bacterium]|jgi:HD-GYP domain-containing protein (c-di-GMP phosphodiesterase class II)